MEKLQNDVSNFLFIKIYKIKILQNCKSLKDAYKPLYIKDYLEASSTATAHATVAPTIGLLPIPIRPIMQPHTKKVVSIIVNIT